MESNDGEDEEYEVERILAERTIEGVPKFLVKWKDYPDEQCTWEPIENFNAPETLEVWKQQKAKGDTLEENDLRRIQNQMDAFQARQAMDEDSSTYSSEGQSDVDFDELELPPSKKLKMVHDPPPLSNKMRSSVAKSQSKPQTKKIVGSPIEASSTRTGSETTDQLRPVRKPVRHPHTRDGRDMSTTKSSSDIKPVTTTAHPSGVVERRKSNARPNIPLTQQPAKFYEPELSQRSRRSSVGKHPKSNLTGKPFKNLRHMNNARKRLQEERLSTLPSPVSLAATSLQPAKTSLTTPKPGNMTSDQPDDPSHASTEQTDASWRLFFSDDEDEEFGTSKGLKYERERRNSPKTARRQSTGNQIEESTTIVSNPDISPQAAEPEHQTSVDVKQEPTSEIASESIPETISVEQSQRSNHDIPSTVETLPARPGDSDSSIDLATAQKVAAQLPKQKPPEVSRNLLTDRAVIDTIATSSKKEPSSAMADSTDTGKQSRNLEGKRPQWHPQPSLSDRAAIQSVHRGDIVRVATGREWVKGDLVIELYVSGHSAGGVKVQYLPWPGVCTEIVRLKPFNKHTLPIMFDHPVSRPEYEAFNHRSWWSMHGSGAVEAFRDSESKVSSVAEFLEEHDIAMLWSHPSETTDLLLVLYSSRSPSWQTIAPNQPTRSGENRLHIAARTKIRSHQHNQNQWNSPPGVTNRTRLEEQNGIEPRADYRREQPSRRTSLVTENDPSGYHDITTSPSEQLTRDLVEYSISDTNNISSNVKENIQTMKNAPVETAPNTNGRDITNKDSEMAAKSHSTNEKTSDPVSHDPRLRTSVNQNSGLLSTLGDVVLKGSPKHSNAPLPNRPSDIALTFPGLDRAVEDLSCISLDVSPKIDHTSVVILLVYKPEDAGQAYDLRGFLTDRVSNSTLILDQPIELNSKQKKDENWKPGNWRKFESYLEKSVCVLICDKKCPINKMGDLAKMVEHDNLLCWQVNMTVMDDRPLETVRIFPLGHAIAIAEDCFLNEPDNVVYILRWIKKRAELPHSAMALVLPPNILTTIQYQINLSTFEETKRKFIQLTSILQELIALAAGNTDSNDLPSMGFTVPRPTWNEVYSSHLQEMAQVPQLEQKKRDRAMSDEFLKYFGAWALMHLANHRRFMGFLTDTKPQDNEHIRFSHCKPFVEADKKSARRREHTRSRSRDMSVDNERRARSRSTGPVERSRERSKSRARSSRRD